MKLKTKIKLCRTFTPVLWCAAISGAAAEFYLAYRFVFADGFGYADPIAELPRVFAVLLVSLISIGSGKLADKLEELQDEFEHEAELRASIMRQLAEERRYSA